MLLGYYIPYLFVSISISIGKYVGRSKSVKSLKNHSGHISVISQWHLHFLHGVPGASRWFQVKNPLKLRSYPKETGENWGMVAVTKTPWSSDIEKNRGYGHSTLMGLRQYITGIWIPTCGLMTIPFCGTINTIRPWQILWKERFQWRNMWISNAASRILSMTQPIFGDTSVDGTNPKQIVTVEIQPWEASALVAFQKHGRNTGLKGTFEADFQSASRTK